MDTLRDTHRDTAMDEKLETTLALLRALADESRLRILGLLAVSERSVEELAAELSLRLPTVSHHLAKLRAVGLVAVRPEGNSRIYSLDLETLRRLSRELLAADRLVALAGDGEGDAWERKVLRDFLDGERLKEIPASRKKREVILRWLAEQFEPGVRYAEPVVNELIGRRHPDFATLRRELVSYRLLMREGGVYWRPAEPAP